MSRLREIAVNTLLHAGWVCIGQECDCGSFPNLNWLARRVDPLLSWDNETLEPLNTRTRVLECVGEALSRLGGRVSDQPVLLREQTADELAALDAFLADCESKLDGED